MAGRDAGPAGELEVRAAAAALAGGAIVAFPTETFYGLAVPALDARAVARLCDLKGREAAQALPVIVDSVAMLERLVVEVPPAARELMARHWPGALTLVLAARPEVPAPLVSVQGVGARVSSHPLATALVRACGVPLTATSANRSGRPPARTAAAVRAAFGDEVYVLDGGTTAGGPPSTVASLDGGRVVVLRAGAVRL
ncbi:MAG: threonylcarbamoyl-AMP synthase [Deltaproteobacteria bacterium]|nr:threonylcarbamoyl-AMP synthase [Deltaproteobacteria bacterium]